MTVTTSDKIRKCGNSRDAKKEEAASKCKYDESRPCQTSPTGLQPEARRLVWTGDVIVDSQTGNRVVVALSQHTLELSILNYHLRTGDCNYTGKI